VRGAGAEATDHTPTRASGRVALSWASQEISSKRWETGYRGLPDPSPPESPLAGGSGVLTRAEARAPGGHMRYSMERLGGTADSRPRLTSASE